LNLLDLLIIDGWVVPLDGEELLERVYKKNFNPKTSLVRRSSLEDVFLRLTGRTLVD
jgi:lipooligosaccharide transport system ATP-binding protein